MYEYLLSRQEKENLLELALLVAEADTKPKKVEKDIIKTYQKKLDLDDYKIVGKSFSQIVDELEKSSFISKTSILFEILRIVIADNEYHPKERDIVSRLRERWEISDEQFTDICFWLKKKDLILDKENEE
jgi:uncharacterized tellurite resistance protein B-like protein